ncbi:ATPase, P-type (transporting), HAD superfamily, subfamily IC [Micromonospora phaseoli]|uniref:ATPase, P-type (Transporting), HAD superfamily, subfamily IC n=1 Tax=Micromonospora phaseoli TaxID=1144548 RepID=A0A1H7BC21_9ACTN|nr:HAD-IC family P-type ATPase [Micromonospora phaseoli]PZV95049.1 P-type E1-E2 ATPase [Micromonospora phaseoli]GIJ79526.1 haloacid dehalogenase [Micromonospora phaseoli]SEJ75211.1 ATPase, P-type (transporting), HAD superfamily, subfamily IC [Micromonospora phaseoli]
MRLGAVPVPPVVDDASRSVAAAATRLARAVGLTSRRIWSRPGRHHIEVHGVCQDGGDTLASQVETALERMPGVLWARVNAPSGRVVVAVDTPGPKVRELVATISRVERSCPHEPDPEIPPPHPPEEGPRTPRTLGALASDALGLTISAATRILPVTPIPGEVAGLLTAIDLHPKLHALAGLGLRRDPRADLLFPLTEAVVQGLTGGWTGIVLDGAQRIVQWGEGLAQLRAWEKAEPRLTGKPDRAVARTPAYERPCPKPDGPVERYINRMLGGGAAAFAAATPVVGAKRAAALGLSALPKAPGSGREGYAAQLGRILARRGVIAMDRSVLRELDRIDTLILDARVLGSDRGVLVDLAPLPGADTSQVAARAFTLFEPTAPTDVRQLDGWRLGPLDRLDVRNPGDSDDSRRLREHGGNLLGLAQGDALTAVLRVEPEPAPGVEVLPAVARHAGLRLVVAGGDAERHASADALVPGGDRLAESVRTLQREGAVVMLVSGDRTALAAADCGLGLAEPDEPPPWGAHLLVGTDLKSVALIIDAAGVARRMTAQNLRIGLAGTGLGALGAFTADPALLPGRTLASVNGAAALAFAHGVWRAGRLSERTESPPPAITAWHLMPVSTVLEQLGTGRDGLTDTTAERRRTGGHGETSGPGGLLRAFVDELANPLTPVLAAGAVLSASFGSLVDAALVGGVVGGSALVGAVHQRNTEKSLAQLLSRSAVTARVRRNGAERVVPAADLVPGDVIVLESGDAIPADCRVLEFVGLEADESSLTGESLPVAKSDQPVVAAAVAERSSMLYEGTTIAAGRGVAVVVATGADTEAGRSLALARQAPPASGVEARLGRLTRAAVPMAAASAVAVVGAGLLRGVPLAQTAATAANLAVASVPEGLPFLVSAAQLAAARRLAEHGALVRNPRTIEALGRVDVLCFDKTGTLTEGHLLLAGVGDADGYAPVEQLDDRLRRALAAALRATPAADDPEALSMQTDRAVLRGARAAGLDEQQGAPGWRAAGGLPFEPSRGYHATVGETQGRLLLSVKGAPETVLPRCSARRTAGRDEPLDDTGRAELQALLAERAGAGHRILAVAECTVGDPDVTDDVVRGLVFTGYLALADGVRASAAPAVRRIRQAGVHTIMITGDHPATAEAIAATISDHDAQRVVTAIELDKLDDDALAERLAATDVVARCTPAHKVRIIQALQKCGRTVAMTGDGANDAPAIRLADVGIALGQRGTPAARAAADLVVTDDRLETIIATLVEGRAMWSSVRHALSILVGGNLGEIAFSVLTAAATGKAALNGRQLLLVNLLTDMAPALAIAVRPPGGDHADALLREGPDSSLGQTMTREIGLRAAATTLGATVGWTLARYTGRRRRAGTVALVSLVGTQLGQTVLAGGTSPTVLASTAASFGVLAIVVQTPGVSHFFGCTPLGPVGWSIATGSALGATLANGALTQLVARFPQVGNPEQKEPKPEAPSDDSHPAVTTFRDGYLP